MTAYGDSDVLRAEAVRAARPDPAPAGLSDCAFAFNLSPNSPSTRANALRVCSPASKALRGEFTGSGLSKRLATRSSYSAIDSSLPSRVCPVDGVGPA